MRPLYRPQQLRLQFRAVLLQIQRRPRLQSHLFVSVRKHNQFAATSLSDEISKLSLSFQNCYSFHRANLADSAA